jgi:hypothetical protein
MAWTSESRDKAAITRQQNKEARLAEMAAKQEAAGIPDSKVFGGSPDALENPVLNCHVGGVMVRDLPVEMQGRILWQQTDEGIAERNEGKSDLHVSVGAEGFDKALQERRANLKDGYEPFEARDPLKEAADKYVGKAMRPKFLSQRRVKENGGTGDYEVVKDGGDPVMVKGMVLAQVPEELARKRNRHYQKVSQERIADITARYVAEGGKTAVVAHGNQVGKQ